MGQIHLSLLRRTRAPGLGSREPRRALLRWRWFPAARVCISSLLLALAVAVNVGCGGDESLPGEDLPRPLNVAAESPEALAAKLAALTDHGSLPAVLASLKSAGFSVANPDGKTLVAAARPTQGVRFGAWEADLIAQGLATGFRVPLSAIGDLVRQSTPELHSAPVETFLLAGIRRMATSPAETDRFWANLLAERGRRLEVPYDLLAPRQPGEISFDTIQTALILQRLLGELWAWSHSETALASNRTSASVPIHRVAESQLAETETGRPCTLREDQRHILDGTTAGTAAGYHFLLEYLEHHGVEGAGRFHVSTSIGTAVLSMLKLYLTFSALDVDIVMAGGQRLVRTVDMDHDGESKTLTARAAFHIDGQMVNCLSFMLNALHLEFDIPQDGVLAEHNAQWLITRGGGLPSGSPILLVWGPGQRPDVTLDDEGKSSIVIQGARQRENLAGKPIVPVDKAGEVTLLVQAESGGFWKDMFDAIIGAVSPVTIPANIALRGRWTGGSLPFTVGDWAVPNEFRVYGEFTGPIGDPNQSTWAGLWVVSNCGDIFTDTWHGSLYFGPPGSNLEATSPDFRLNWRFIQGGFTSPRTWDANPVYTKVEWKPLHPVRAVINPFTRKAHVEFGPDPDYVLPASEDVDLAFAKECPPIGYEGPPQVNPY